MAIYKKKGKGVVCRLNQKDLAGIETQKKIHGHLFDISASARYVCIYLLNKNNRYAFVYGCNNDFNSEFPLSKEDNALHNAAHDKAFAGNRVIYEWFRDTDHANMFQSTILPLTNEEGEVESILGIIKVLDRVAVEDKDGLSVAENPAQSFVRLLINAREEEKRKMSSALHDEIGTAAVVINSLLGILKEDIKDEKKNAALNTVSNLSEAFSESLSKIKKVIFDLRPPQLEDVGLNAAVKNLIDTLSQTVPLKFEYNYKIKERVKLSEQVKITLYRVVQEAISNTLKHAEAKTIKIDFSEDESTIYLKIQDDGVGYPGGNHRTVNKLGILGMKENLSYIGGSIKIKGIKGKGTTISVECPKITYMR